MTLRDLTLNLLWGAVLALSPSMALGRGEGSIQKTWDYPEGIRSVMVDAERQDIIVKTGGPRLTGRLVGDGADSVKVVRDGDKLMITVKSDRGWFSWRRLSSKVELSVPAGITLDLTTASGAVLVEATTTTLRVRTASGDIEASQGGGPADVDSASGTIRLQGFHGPITASALSGDLILDDVSGLIQASTLSGSLRATRVAPEAQSRFTTVSGDAVLKLVSGAGSYLIHAKTVSGSIAVGGTKGHDDLTTGSGPSVIVKAVSGDIRIE